MRDTCTYLRLCREYEWCYDAVWGPIAEELGFPTHTEEQKIAVLKARLGIEEDADKRALAEVKRVNEEWARTHPEEDKMLDTLQGVCNYMTSFVLGPKKGVPEWQIAQRWLEGQRPSWDTVFKALECTRGPSRLHVEDGKIKE